jgi:flagellar protein FliS
MSFAHPTALRAYQSAGLEVSVSTADPHKLILMLFDGALLAVAQAKQHMEAGNVAAKGSAVSRAVRIIDEGLKASLDTSAERAVAQQLWQLYEYMCRRLLLASLHNEAAGVDEVSRLLKDIREAWEQIDPDRRVQASAVPLASVSARR